MRTEPQKIIKEMKAHLGTTTIYVTVPQQATKKVIQLNLLP